MREQQTSSPHHCTEELLITTTVPDLISSNLHLNELASDPANLYSLDSNLARSNAISKLPHLSWGGGTREVGERISQL